MKSHFAIIGITAGIDEYPLYYDACNEKGVAIAGLNFAGNAIYREIEEDMVNVTPFEFIPYLLSQSESIDDVKELLLNLNLVNINYSENLPLSPLHWMISDENSSIIVEPLEDGLKVYDNPVGVLTNNPTFYPVTCLHHQDLQKWHSLKKIHSLAKVKVKVFLNSSIYWHLLNNRKD